MVLKISLIFVLFVAGSIAVEAKAENPVTNQEIRDAILSLVHSYSLLDNKLERHEQRERALGELVKKGLMTLQKNQRILEPIKAAYDRLEKKAGEIEAKITTSDGISADQNKKLSTLLEKILENLTNPGASAAIQSRTSDSSTEDDDEALPKKVDDLIDIVEKLRKEIAELRAEQTSIETTNKNLVSHTESLVKLGMAQTEEVIGKLDEKMSQFYITNTQDVKSSDFEVKITKTLNDIEGSVNKMLNEGSSVSTSGSTSGFSPADRNFITGLKNETLEALEDMRLEVLTASDKSFAKTATRIKESNDAISEVSKMLAESITNADTFYTDSQKSLTDVKTDVEGLNKLEKILLDTSNNALETKRRFEYGIHQIILEVSDVVKTVNGTLQKRFNEMDQQILENHNGAMSNLSAKIETEISQVWRQIGIMYQEITASKQALDRLQEQTEVYVNGTITSMDSMQGKVGLITNRMAEVDENLNYLLGRLSLVTQEFLQIKTGLGDALINIRNSFKAVQNMAKDIGPGPHRIDEREEEYNALSKRN
ncbi:unnamed protein product, partial [Diamesa serratosioi]